MQDYKEIINNMIYNYESEIEKALFGDISQYCYLQGENGDGIYDLNYNNRLRLLYAILFNTKYNYDEHMEGIIRKLFLEELKDRKTNSFQGIGTNLEILSEILSSYQREEDIKLFTEAKNANFDCACGYDWKEKMYSREVGQYSIEGCISIANELEEYDISEQLINLWEEQQETMDISTYKTLKYWEQDRKDSAREIEILEKILELSLETNDEGEICSAYQNYIRKLIESSKYVKAAEKFYKLIPHLLLSRQEWYGIGLGRFALEDCMDIVVNCEKESLELWKWSKPFIIKLKENMHGNLYEKSAKAAKKMGDQKLSTELLERWNKLMANLKK